MKFTCEGVVTEIDSVDEIMMLIQMAIIAGYPPGSGKISEMSLPQEILFQLTAFELAQYMTEEKMKGEF